MMEASTARIAMTTFSGTSLRTFASTDLDEILSKVDRDANTFIHLVHSGPAWSTKILGHFGLPASLAEQIDSAAALELDTASDRYLLKNFRFIEQSPDQAARAKTAETSVLIRGSETDRFTEGHGSIVVGDRFVLLFEGERASPMIATAIEDVLRRERELRERGIEYLLYRLVKSSLVDNYFTLMRQLMDELQDLEGPLLDGSTDTGTYRKLARLRRELNPFERSLLHVAEFTVTVTVESPKVQAGFSYLVANLGTDCERLEKEFSMLRDRASELIQAHRDNVSTQLNNTMRRLTVLSAMFLPLTFITGFYGMNFPGMPTLHWSGTFPIVIALMVAVVAGSLVYARRQDWL